MLVGRRMQSWCPVGSTAISREYEDGANSVRHLSEWHPSSSSWPVALKCTMQSIFMHQAHFAMTSWPSPTLARLAALLKFSDEPRFDLLQAFFNLFHPVDMGLRQTCSHLKSPTSPQCREWWTTISLRRRLRPKPLASACTRPLVNVRQG
jgi:hypothetical protein